MTEAWLKVAHYTFKYFLKSAENYLIMIDNIMDKKYLSQIGKKKKVQFWMKNNIFEKLIQ